MFDLDYLHAVIKEVSEAEERGLPSDDAGAQAAGSSEDLDGDGVGITFTARKASSKFSLFLIQGFFFFTRMDWLRDGWLFTGSARHERHVKYVINSHIINTTN